VNGIVVSGNIASPYATISIGGSGPITLPMIVIENTTSPGITIINEDAAAGSDIRFVAFSPTQKPSYMDWYESDGTTRRGYIGFGDSNDETFFINLDSATGNIILRTDNTSRLNVSADGAIAIAAPTSDTALTVDGAAGHYTAILNGSATSGASFGMQILAGSTGADMSLSVQSSSGAQRLLVLGNGNIAFHGVTPTAQSTGWGTPTGPTKVANFPGASATLVQCSEVISQILTDLKSLGLYGA
jgi:hypothetical protein